MTAITLLHTLQTAGIRLMAHGEQLAADCLPGVMTDELRRLIRRYKPGLLALLQPQPPRHAGGFPVTDVDRPCAVCGGPDWQQHATYRYCLHCGREAVPGPTMDVRQTPAA